MTVTYRFPIELFYQPESLRAVSDMMEKFGSPLNIGMSGSFGQTDVNISSEDDTEPVVPADKLKKMQEILQDTLNEIVEKKDIKDFKLTVKAGYKL